MKCRIRSSHVLAVLLMGTIGCATLKVAHHAYFMRGQVLDVTDGVAYLCIGRADGAKVGQQLDAHRFIPSRQPSSKSNSPVFRRENTGKVTILEIVDEHYARARVDTGGVAVGDMVELQMD